MKLYIKLIISILVVVFFIFIYNEYKSQSQLENEIKNIALGNSKALASLVLSYEARDVDKKTRQISFFYDYKDSKYTVDILNMSNPKTEDKFIKKAIAYLDTKNSNSYYFQKITQTEYMYVYYIKRVNSKSLLVVYSDIKKLRKNLFSQYNKKLVKYFIIFTILAILLYLVLKDAYLKGEDQLKKLQSEINKKTKNIEKKNKVLKHQLYHDKLTGLPNREQLLEDLKSQKDDSALVLLNIDKFKEINDFYGIEIGDEVLVAFGNFLTMYLEDMKCCAYKLHSDEYAIFCNSISRESLDAILMDLEKEIKSFSVITEDDFSVEVQATMGISFGDKNILSNADMVLKRAKSRGLTHLYFDDSMMLAKEFGDNIEWTKKLKIAIKNNKLINYCQPIFFAKNSNLAKYEVLVRLKDKDNDIISPFVFLDVAKQNKLYPYITKAVIQQAFDYFTDTDIKFSINLSILDILNPWTTSFILEHLDNYPKPSNITFEILESEGIENHKEVMEFIKKIKSYGCLLAIDDFGVGYSNFEYMLKLQVDLIKIDASLIKNIHTNNNAKVIVNTIVSFAKSLGIKTCAEFVHCKEVCDELKAMGVTYLQGYHLGEPIPMENI